MVSHEFAVKPSHWVELQASQDWNGVTYSLSTSLMVVGRLQTGLHSVPCHAAWAFFPQDFSQQGSLFSPCEWRERGSKGERAEESSPNGSQSLYNLIPGVLSPHFSPILLMRSKAISAGDTEGARMIQGHGKREVGFIGGHFRGYLQKSC